MSHLLTVCHARHDAVMVIHPGGYEFNIQCQMACQQLRMNQSKQEAIPSIQWNSIAISICHGHRKDKQRKLTNIIKNNIWKNEQNKKETEKKK
jgi:hypothetical protein